LNAFETVILEMDLTYSSNATL